MFVKGANGEGARRGRNGLGAAVGDIIGNILSLCLIVKTESLRGSKPQQQDTWTPIKEQSKMSMTKQNYTN